MSQSEQVEEAGSEDPCRARLLARTEAAHRLLERAWGSCLVEHQGFAVEDELVGVEPAREVSDLGHAVGDVGEAAGVDGDLLAPPVHLDAGAVEFVLHTRWAGDRQGRCDIGCRRREHRLDGHTDPQGHALDRVRIGERESGGHAEITDEHHGTADNCQGPADGFCECVCEDSVEGAGADVPEQCLPEEVTLGWCRPTEQLRHSRLAGGARARPRDVGDRLEGLVDVTDREDGVGGRWCHGES